MMGSRKKLQFTWGIWLRGRSLLTSSPSRQENQRQVAMLLVGFHHSDVTLPQEPRDATATGTRPRER